MTGEQFEQAIRALGYNQSSFARAISHNVRTVQSWRQGRLPVPPQIAMLVELMGEAKTSLGPDLVGEFARLRDENEQLKTEIEQMDSRIDHLCAEIRQLKQKPCPACGWPGWQK